MGKSYWGKDNEKENNARKQSREDESSSGIAESEVESFKEDNDKDVWSNSSRRPIRLDATDLTLAELLISGHTTKESAKILEKPVSTIQRRGRLLIQRGVLKPTFELGFSRLGIKKGFLHIYLNDGDLSVTVDKLLARDGVFSVGVHLGNSDIVGLFAFNDSRQVLDLIEWAKHQAGVEQIVWSEEVYARNTRPKLAKIIGQRVKMR
jgi:hypothetical protein